MSGLKKIVRSKNMGRVGHTYKIFGDDSEGAFLEVAEDEECYEILEVRTTNELSEQYYGKIRLPLNKEMARLLGETLIRASNEMEK
jgi:hypothetical protein